MLDPSESGLIHRARSTRASDMLNTTSSTNFSSPSAQLRDRWRPGARPSIRRVNYVSARRSHVAPMCAHSDNTAAATLIATLMTTSRMTSFSARRRLVVESPSPNYASQLRRADNVAQHDRRRRGIIRTRRRRRSSQAPRSSSVAVNELEGIWREN